MAAMENPHINAHMIDASEFPDLSAEYEVSSVPQTVIDGSSTVVFIGKYPENRFVAEILKAVQS